MTITECYVNSKELEGRKIWEVLNDVELLIHNRQQASIKLRLK